MAEYNKKLNEGPESVQQIPSKEEGAEEEASGEVETGREDQDFYNEFLNDLKRELIAQTAGKPERTVFDFNRVTQDLTNFNALV